MKNRIAVVFLFVSICWSLLFLRGMFVQIWPQKRLNELKSRLFETTIEIPARRGLILDRDGKELAVSVNGHGLFADPHLIPNRKVVAPKIAKLLKISKTEVLQKLKDTSKRFIWLKRGLSDEQKFAVEQLKIRGLGFIEEPRRVYPQDHLASQILGFVGADGRGLEGLELQLDEKLRGQSRRVLLPRDARGRPLLQDGHALTDVPDGSSVTLTLDSELQYALESELETATRLHKAKGAVGVVLDAQTSEILALAHVPLVDSNHAFKENPEDRRGRAVTDAFEPGSTLKPFVIAAALHERTIKPGTKIDCEGGKLSVGGHLITEAEATHQFRVLTVSEILAASSNVGMAKIGLGLGAERLRNFLDLFGFGHSTGVEFPGESRGVLLPLPWRPHLLSNIAFGQGITVTPLQLAQAYAAIANGGFLRKPSIIKSVQNFERGEVLDFKLPQSIRVLTPQEASILTYMLTSATSAQGTGFNARIPGFPVAGKTGTAQKIDAGRGLYKKDSYIASFAGFVPAHDPRFVIYIAVDEPKNGYYASQTAAPVFSKIAQYAVRKKGLIPVLIENKNVLASAIEQPLVKTPEMARGLVPQFMGLTLREVYQKSYGLPLRFDVHGSGVVARTVPEAGQSLPPTARVKLILQKTE